MEGDHKCSETKTEQTERDNDQPQRVTRHTQRHRNTTTCTRVRLHINDNSLITNTSGQRILMKGRIADLSPLAAANGFVRTWCHLVHGSLNPHESALQTASRSLQPFFRTPLQKPTMFFTGADNPKIARSRWIGYFSSIPVRVSVLTVTGCYSFPSFVPLNPLLSISPSTILIKGCMGWRRKITRPINISSKPNTIHIGLASYGALRHMPPLDLQRFFQCLLTNTESDSDYMLTVASCKHPVTFVPLLAPNLDE